MNQIDISKYVERLISALQIEKNEDTHFTEWLAALCEMTQANHGQLILSTCDTSITRTWQYPNTHKNSSAGINSEQYLIDHQEGDLRYSLTLYFESIETLHDVQNTLSILNTHIKMCLSIGHRHHISHQQQYFRLQSLDAMNLGFIQINKKGQLLSSNSLADMLFTGQQLSIENNVVKLGNEFITKKIQSDLPTYFQWQYKDSVFFSSLSVSPQNPSNWHPTNQLSLTIQPLKYAPDPKWLESLLHINESQAVVASYTCLGLSAKEIARLSNLSTHTVYSYLKIIYEKLNIKNQSQLASAIWPKIPL